jgi:LuxR family maltose regulon positive regulatory protein
VALVLDDYHMISNRHCHDQLEFVLLHLPQVTQIVLVTRMDPPLPLGRLRAVGDLLEIRVPELRFVAAEADALVRAVSAVQLDETDLADLVQRTEGWPAGIYLAALSLRGHPSPSSFIRQFTGDNRFVGDFLVQEVLSRQPGEIRHFLCRTAILDRFTASLCDAVVGSANAAEIIDILERENLFLVALDDDRQWFRYHQLFGQMLLSQLVQAEPDLVPVLHQRASEWHQRWGSVEEAVVHALAGGDIAGAIDVVARNWPGCVDTGRIRALRAWLDSIGDDRIRDSPVAAHCAAWCAALSGEPDPARRWLAVVEAGGLDGPLPDGMPSLEFSAALLRGIFGLDGISAMRESAATATELDTNPSSPWYALARTALGAALYLSGEFDAAFAQLSDAIQGDASLAAGRLLACSVMALVAVERGRLGQAQELVAAARQIAGDGDLGDAPRSAIVYTASGAVAAMQGRLQEARGSFEHALRASRRCAGISPWVALDTMLRLAPVLYDLGDSARAAVLLSEARAVLASRPDGAKAQLLRAEQAAKRLASRRPQPLAEPLSEREEEVLRLLRGTLSLREIGQELFLSANTIKTHTRAIYRKLGVTTRQEAVERGRDMGIL